MQSYLVNVLVWSFSIYGVLSFLKEYLLESTCYIILKGIYICKLCKKYVNKVAKKTR